MSELRAFGKVDPGNSAGARSVATIDFPEHDWDAIIDTNLTGTLRACQVFGKHMLERESGSIINIASLSTFVALHEVAAYSASKAAVASLTKSLAVEWSSRGVRVNAIAPGVFRTALNQKLLDETERGREFLLRTPMRRFGNVEELRRGNLLASDAASFVPARYYRRRGIPGKCVINKLKASRHMDGSRSAALLNKTCQCQSQQRYPSPNQVAALLRRRESCATRRAVSAG